MHTYLPFANFAKSASVLDSGRLQKQLIDCKMLVTAHLDERFGWQTHRAKTMWNGHARALCVYAVAMVAEAMKRGVHVARWDAEWFEHMRDSASGALTAPWWLGDTRLHSSHRAALRRAHPYYYRAFADDPTTVMWWPNRREKARRAADAKELHAA